MDRKEEHQSRENEKQRKRIKGNCSGNMLTKSNNTTSFSLDSNPLRGALSPGSIFTITICKLPKNLVQTVSVSPYPSNRATFCSLRNAMSQLMCIGLINHNLK